VLERVFNTRFDDAGIAIRQYCCTGLEKTVLLQPISKVKDDCEKDSYHIDHGCGCGFSCHGPASAVGPSQEGYQWLDDDSRQLQQGFQ
jgi:hypothetical protein